MDLSPGHSEALALPFEQHFRRKDIACGEGFQNCPGRDQRSFDVQLRRGLLPVFDEDVNLVLEIAVPLPAFGRRPLRPF